MHLDRKASHFGTGGSSQAVVVMVGAVGGVVGGAHQQEDT